MDGEQTELLKGGGVAVVPLGHFDHFVDPAFLGFHLRYNKLYYGGYEKGMNENVGRELSGWKYSARKRGKWIFKILSK